MRKFVRDVSAQVAAWLVIAALGLIAAWLVSLTPLLELFAPFSYFLAFVLVAALAALAFFLMGLAKHKWFPSAEPDSNDERTEAELAVAYDDADIRKELAELRASIEAMRDEKEEPQPESWEASAPPVITPTPAEQFLALKERVNQAKNVTTLIEELVALVPPEADYEKHDIEYIAHMSSRHLDRKLNLEQQINSIVSAYKLVPPDRLEREIAAVAERMKGDAHYLPQNDQPMKLRVAARDALIRQAQWEAYIPQIQKFLRDAENRLETLRVQMVERASSE